MVKNRHKIIFLFSFILFGFCLNSILISVNDFQTIDYYEDNEIEGFKNLKFAAALNYSDIIQNATTIYRLFDSINFTIDTSYDFPDADQITMEIQFSNKSIRNYDMDNVTTSDFYYEYIPEYDAPLGFQKVSFYIYNDTQTLLNNHTTYTNFTIKTNCMANFFLDGLLSTEYYINDTLEAELIVNNFNYDNDSKTYEFQWDLTIVDSMDEATQNNLLDLKSNVNYFTLLIDNETFQQVNKIYYLKVNMTDETSGKNAAAYFPFNIKNSNPIITSEIDLSPDELFRTEEFVVSVNVTDLETAADELTITAEVQDSEGQDIDEKILGHRGDNLFTIGFSIPSNRPAGTYRVTVTAMDKNNGNDSKLAYLDVKNNFPEIHNYKINGLSMNQSISVFYGRSLVFSFNVSDKEGVSSVKVALLNENDEWFNITREYKGEDTEITIRTQDLISGIWYIYIYVIDIDGAVTSLIDDYDMAPQGITIVPDVLSNYIPWIVFISGLSIGVLIGIGIIYTYFKLKIIGIQPVSAEKKTIQSKKPIKKKKVKTKKIDEDSKKKETVEVKHEEAEEKEGLPKRKIRRKL
ncbi:MAG: hypothetical protein HWN81_11035, partial [Candidatus Lokiarchaeota archaeon]|nr:hypothetical protein [Candidatus Lokiarchaeota archaeon]